MVALRQQHESIGTIAGKLGQATSDNRKPQAVAALRWQLARELMAHLALEDRILYPALQRTADANVRTTAARIQAEIGALAESFARYMSAWSDDKISREWPAFCADTAQILRALSDRINREDDILYPLAQAAETAVPPVARAG